MIGGRRTLRSYLLYALLSVALLSTILLVVIYVHYAEKSRLEQKVESLSLNARYTEHQFKRIVGNAEQLSSLLASSPQLTQRLPDASDLQTFKRAQTELNKYLSTIRNILDSEHHTVRNITILDDQQLIFATTDLNNDLSNLIQHDRFLPLEQTNNAVQFHFATLNNMPFLALKQSFNSPNENGFSVLVGVELNAIFNSQSQGEQIHTSSQLSVVFKGNSDAGNLIYQDRWEKGSGSINWLKLGALNKHDEMFYIDQLSLGADIGYAIQNERLKLAIIAFDDLPQPLWLTPLFWISVTSIVLVVTLVMFVVSRVISRQIVKPLDDLLIMANDMLNGTNTLCAPSNQFEETERLSEAISTLAERMQTALSCANLNQDFVLESVREGVIIFDEQGTIIKVNPSFTEMTSFEVESLLGNNINTLLKEHDQYLIMGLAYKLMSESEKSSKVDPKDVTIICADKSEIITSSTITKLVKLEHCLFLMVLTDVTEKIQYQKKLEHLALHDSLTDLPKMLLASERLEAAINSAKRSSSLVAVMFVDLDLFKPINDQYGHAAGDLVLRVVANRMKESLRQSDTVARIGGDEFLVIAPEVKDSAQALILAQKLNHLIEQFIDIGYEKVKVGASIGISMFPSSSNNKEMLIALADEAMYRIKAEGRQGCKLHPSCTGDEADNVTVLYSHSSPTKTK